MTAHVRLCRLLLAAAASALALAMPGAAAELNPAALAYKLPDQIKWNPPSAAGSQNEVLVGDPSKPGLYVVRNKWLKGDHFSRPHFHPNDRFITVLSGTWWMGSGATFDPDHSVGLPAGTFVTHFGKASALGRGQGRGCLAADRRRWSRNEHAGRARHRPLHGFRSRCRRLHFARSIQVA